MSAVATAAVWSRSKATGSQLLVLLAVADAANQQGQQSYQSVATLASMARVSESTVHRALAGLLEAGEIVHTGDHAQYGTRIYALGPSMTGGVSLTPPQQEGGVTQAPEGVSPVTPKPTTNPTTTSGTGSSPPPVGDAGAGERQGQMTTSWRPMPSTKHAVQESCPNINYVREVHAFMDWHIGKGDGRVATQSQWDALFRNWCARKQTEWEKEHPDNGMDADPVTGMPLHPRPAFPADSPR